MANAGLRIGCVSWNSNLKTHLIYIHSTVKSFFKKLSRIKNFAPMQCNIYLFWRFASHFLKKSNLLGRGEFGLILLTLFTFKTIHCAMRWRKMACLCWHKSFVEGRNPKVGIRKQILTNHCIAPMVKSLSNNHLGTIHILRKHISEFLYPLYVL